MKNLFKSILIIAFIAFGFQSNAQFNLGVKAGLNMSNVSNIDNTKMKFGYHAGFVANAGLTGGLGMQTGLILSSKGFAADIDHEDDYSRTSYMYLEVPINITYTVIEKIQLSVGPYVAFGVAGKNKTKTTVLGKEIETDITLKPKYGEAEAEDFAKPLDELPFNGLDFGLNFGLGYNVTDNISVNAGYSLGLAYTEAKMKDIDRDSDNKTSNRVISVGLTYSF